MKEVRAYIKPHKLGEVTMALRHVEGFPGMTVLDARGCGRGHTHRHRESPEDAIDHAPSVRIEVICSDVMLDAIVEAIERHAHTGLRGDGKICVLHVEQTIRISTGERGEHAV